MSIKINIPIPDDVLDSEKRLLLKFHGLLYDLQANQPDSELISDLILQMADLFMIVIAGEFNSGKTAFINALLGDEYLAMGVTPTTSTIQILRYGSNSEKELGTFDQNIVYIPEEILKNVTIVDTPGTNAVLREHEELTTDFIPRSDLVLFITSADRPFTESERLFLGKIKEWGKKIVIVINKIDIIDTRSELEEVLGFVTTNARNLLNMEPKIFLLSAKQALLSKKTTGFSNIDLQQIEKYIQETLLSTERIKLKLLNPLGVIEHLAENYFVKNQEKLENLKQDNQLLSDIETQIKLFREDTLRSYKFRYSEIDNVLLKFEKRGLEFFDDNFRIAKIFDLLNKEKIQADYKKDVIQDLNSDIDLKVNGLIDWLVEEDLKQWQAITNKIDKRVSGFEERIFDGSENSRFVLERKKIIDSIKRESQRLIEKFNKDDEAKQIADDAQMAIAASAAIEAGALGLGALVTILATSASADLTGVLLAGLTATLGFFILPAKKKQARSLFSKNLQRLRGQLSESLIAEFTKQVDAVVEKVRTTISPYSRFIRSENNKYSSFLERINEIKQEKNILEKRINQL